MARVSWREVVASLLILGGPLCGPSIHPSSAAELAAGPVAPKSAPARAAADKQPQPLKVQVGQLLKLGSKSTRQAIDAAKARYEALREKTGGDARVEFAYGLVLVEQHRYADANRQLAAIVKAHPADLHAWRLKVWAQMLRKSYDGALADMQRLAKLYPEEGATVAAADDELLQDTAFLIGQMCGYLEGPRAEVVKKLELKRAIEGIQDAAGTNYWGSFAEGRSDVVQRFAQAQRELAVIAAADKNVADKKKSGGEKRVAFERGALEQRQDEAQKKAQSLADDGLTIKQIEGEVQSLRDQQAIVDARAAAIEAQTESAAAQVVSSRTPNPNQQINSVVRPANSMLRNLNRESANIKLRISSLLARRTSLLARREIEGGALDRTASQIRMASKQLHAAEKQLRRDGQPTRSADDRLLTAQLRSLRAYEEFDAEAEKAHILAGFKAAQFP